MNYVNNKSAKNYITILIFQKDKFLGNHLDLQTIEQWLVTYCLTHSFPKHPFSTPIKHVFKEQRKDVFGTSGLILDYYSSLLLTMSPLDFPVHFRNEIESYHPEFCKIYRKRFMLQCIFNKIEGFLFKKRFSYNTSGRLLQKYETQKQSRAVKLGKNGQK